MDKVRRRGLISLAILAIAAAVALSLGAWFLWWFFTDFYVFRGA